MVPEGWMTRRLAECAERITSGGTPRVGQSDYYDGDIPFLKIDDLTTNRGLYLKTANTSITQKALEETSVKLYPANTVLVTMYGTIGAVGITEIPMAANQAIGAFLKLTGVTPDFLAYLLSREAPALSRKAGQTTQSNINGGILKNHEVVLPPISEQRKVAAILSSVDDAIENTQAVIDQVQVVKRGLMQELLTRGLPGWHTRFKQTEIGAIPQEWQVKKLSEVANVQTGLAKNMANAGVLSVPYLRVANVQDGFLDLTDVKSVEVNSHALPRYALKPGDVLFTEGGDADKLGRGAVWTGEIEPCLHQNHVFVARSRGMIRPMFLSLYRGSPRGRTYFLNCSKKTTNLASMNSTQLKNLPLPIPGLDEQDQIVARFHAIDGRLSCEEDFLSGLNHLKSALMSVLLTGELRVSWEGGLP